MCTVYQAGNAITILAQDARGECGKEARCRGLQGNLDSQSILHVGPIDIHAQVISRIRSEDTSLSVTIDTCNVELSRQELRTVLFRSTRRTRISVITGIDDRCELCGRRSDDRANGVTDIRQR